MVRFLLLMGADPTISNDKCKTPLQIAQERYAQDKTKFQPVIEFLQNNPARISLLDHSIRFINLNLEKYPLEHLQLLPLELQEWLLLPQNLETDTKETNPE